MSADLSRLRVREDHGQLRLGDFLTRAEFDHIERLRNAQFILVRNDGGDYGERLRCQNGRSEAPRYGQAPVSLGHLHTYFTYMCVERPFRGLEEGLRCWIRATRPGPRRSAILDGLAFGLADYASAHPETARAITPATPGTLAWYSLLVGTHEPITRERAGRLAQRINDRRPAIPFVL